MTNQARFGRVALVFGGHSAERDVSLKSGEAVLKALKSSGVDVTPIDPKVDGLEAIANGGFARVWNALHGRGGEDGVMQSFFELHQLAYTGSGVMASALAMDKLRTKLVWQALDLPVAKHIMLDDKAISHEKAQGMLNQLAGCAMVKPIREGSSVGMAKVVNAEQLVEAVAEAQNFDREVMLEQWIDGEEFTVAVLNGEALPSIKLETPNDFYDYQAKYQSQKTQYHCPSGLSEEDEMQIQELALKAFAALDCSGWGRVDFLRDRQNKQWVLLEANTVPGMTEASLVPKAAKVASISFEQLVIKVLETSLANKG